MSVDQAVQLYWKYVHNLHNLGYEVYSPACTNSPAGFQWIQDFVKQIEQQGGKVCSHSF